MDVLDGGKGEAVMLQGVRVKDTEVTFGLSNGLPYCK